MKKRMMENSVRIMSQALWGMFHQSRKRMSGQPLYSVRDYGMLRNMCRL